MNEKLTYSEYRGCKNILVIDLHNNYSIIAIKIWDYENEKFIVELHIKDNRIDNWDLIEEAESLEFNVDYRIINKAILKHVADLLSSGFFNYYIERYKYEQDCFNVGNEYYESKRLDNNNVM